MDNAAGSPWGRWWSWRRGATGRLPDPEKAPALALEVSERARWVERRSARRPISPEQAIAYWMGQGLTKDQALSVVGNERGENTLGGLTAGDHGHSVGQFQWDATRRAAIKAGTGIDVETAGFMDQQKAARWEMEHSPDAANRVWAKLKEAQNVGAAVGVMVHNFERSANQASDIAIRMGHAERYRKLMEAPTPPAAAVAPGAAPKAKGIGETGKGVKLGPGEYVGHDSTGRRVLIGPNGEAKSYIDPAKPPAELPHKAGEQYTDLESRFRVHPDHRGRDWRNMFQVAQSEAQHKAEISHHMAQTNTIHVHGAGEPALVGSQIASRIKRDATDLSSQMKGVLTG